jgi:hypothetical protein
MRDLDRLSSDVLSGARLAGFDPDPATVERMLDVFRDGFADESVNVNFKTTSGDSNRRGYFFRYCYVGDRKPGFGIAEDAGLLPQRNEPLYALIPEAHERIPFAGGAVDCEVNHGLSKIWHFTRGMTPIEEAFSLRSAPRSLGDHEAFLREFHLERFSVIGCDRQHGSMNLYFWPLLAEQHTPEYVTGMIASRHFALPPEDVVAECCQSGVIALTFRWDSAELERMCFYKPKHDRRTIPNTLPEFQVLADRTPSLAADPNFVIGWSFGSGGNYQKIEIDYTGDLLQLIATVMSGSDAHVTKRRTTAAAP